MGLSFDDGGNSDDPDKTIDLPHVTDKAYHIMLYRVHLSMSSIRTHNYNDYMHCLHFPVVNPTAIQSDVHDDPSKQY